MTPEDKIIAAIDRNTKEVSDSLNFIRLMLVIIIGLLLSIAIPLRGEIIFLPEANQLPLFDIGDPPKPPANPHIQHWYTMDVPGPDGVLPVEVFAPRLYSPAASVGPVELDVPEPGTWITLLLGLIGGIAFAVWSRRAKIKRRKLLIEAIRKLEPNASTLAIGHEVEGGVQFGGIYVELESMRKEGILTMRVERGGTERGNRDRVFYSIRTESTGGVNETDRG